VWVQRRIVLLLQLVVRIVTTDLLRDKDYLGYGAGRLILTKILKFLTDFFHAKSLNVWGDSMLSMLSFLGYENSWNIQGAYKLSEYFANLDDIYILCNEIVHTTFGSTSQSDHDVQIAVGTRVEPPQISGHTNYSRSVRQLFPSNTGLRFSREMEAATIGQFQMLRSLCVTDMIFTILRHFLLKLWRNEILR
jgi:hypothetical protein